MHAIKHLQEFYRVVATLYITERGMYRAIPEDYTSLLAVEVVYRICHADKDGRVVIQDFENPVSATQKYNPDTSQYYNVYGGPVYLDNPIDGTDRSNVYWFTEAESVDVGGSAGGAVTLTLTTKVNAKLALQFNAACTRMHIIAKSEEGFSP